MRTLRLFLISLIAIMFASCQKEEPVIIIIDDNGDGIADSTQHETFVVPDIDYTTFPLEHWVVKGKVTNPECITVTNNGFSTKCVHACEGDVYDCGYNHPSYLDLIDVAGDRDANNENIETFVQKYGCVPPGRPNKWLVTLTEVDPITDKVKGSYNYPVATFYTCFYKY